MKSTVFFAQNAIMTVIIVFTCVSCSSSKLSSVSLRQQRFTSRMKLYIPENRHLLKKEHISPNKRDAFLNELDMLYRQLIESDDIETFQTIVEIDSSVAASIGVFGVMEIANRNYMIKPSSKQLRKRCLEVLAEFTTHSSPHVRTAALYSLGEMRQDEYKDFVINRLHDTGSSSHIFFPPFIESTNGMSTDVHTQAIIALTKILGKAEASVIINSAFQTYLNSKAVSEKE
jgi:hypothetical protein